jgi:flagellar basal-body rod protein FlgG
LGPIKDKHLYPLDGRDQSFVVHDGTYVNHRPGALQVTNGNLDFAVDGKGFFEVATPGGPRFTRRGNFQINEKGWLVTQEGFPVLARQQGGQTSAQSAVAVQPSQGGPSTQGGVAAGQYGPEVMARIINLSDTGGKFSVGEEGEILAGDREVARMAVAEFRDLNGLRKVGSSYFQDAFPNNRVDTDPNRSPATTRSMIRQGWLETSNVNPVEEMTKLIQAHRMFEHDLKAMKVHDEMMAKEVNDVGKL